MRFSSRWRNSSRTISLRLCLRSQVLEGANSLAFNKTGISRDQEWHRRKFNTIRKNLC